MLSKIVESGSTTIDLAELGITDMATVLADMNENENLLEDLEKPWEEKLAEKKEADMMRTMEMHGTQDDSNLLEESKDETISPLKDQKNNNDSLF